MIWISDARPLAGHRLWVRFSDGTSGEVDLHDFIFADARPIVAELRDPAVFATLAVELETVVWANGVDLAPEFLRERVTGTRSG